ncbi:hypothetical protein Q5P01_000372, partial [Channa striata]
GSVCKSTDARRTRGRAAVPGRRSKQVELSTASLLKVAPTEEERKIVHSLFLNTLDTKYDCKLQPSLLLLQSSDHSH